MYGGTTSIMIGSYSWSQANDELGQATVRSGETYFRGFAVNMSDVTIINSIAVSNTVYTGKL